MNFWLVVRIEVVMQLFHCLVSMMVEGHVAQAVEVQVLSSTQVKNPLIQGIFSFRPYPASLLT